MLIAHSGGCFLLPEDRKASLILLVGLPCQTTDHPVKGLTKKMRNEAKDVWWCKKTMVNIWYLLTKPLRWLRMYRAWKSNRLPQYPDSTIVMVRNKDDYLMHPAKSFALANKEGWEIEKLAGQHDDIWENPKPYVELIKQYHV